MINLYYHGGSANHGCEAIVRSTVKLLGCMPVLYSLSPEEDVEYGVDQAAIIVNDTYEPVKRGTLEYLICAVDHKLFGHDYQFVRHGHRKMMNRITRGDICLSIGGDNYCYSGTDRLSYYNRMLHEKGCKTVLWGCSIEPSVLTKSVIDDLKKYDLITVRESLSYEGLVNAGIVDNVLQCADPAFCLDYVSAEFPHGFDSKHTIGINVSPLATECGNLVMENYVEMIRYILEDMGERVLLIPHVVKPDSDDRGTLMKLYNAFADTGRISMLQDCNCMKLKGIISQCRMFVGARTHATIAAYSTGVPTLVAGYSIKAKGIAKDLFGTADNYVIPVQGFDHPRCLKNAFIWLCAHENEIRDHLNNVMPDYKKRAMTAVEAVQRMVNHVD